MSFIADTIRNQMGHLGISVQQVAIITGLRSQNIFAGLSGRVPLSGPDLERIDGVLKRLQQIVHVLRPIPVDFTDTRMTKLLLEWYATGDLEKLMSPHAAVLSAEASEVIS